MTDAEVSADLSWCVGLGSGCVESSFESTALGRPSLTSDEGMLDNLMDLQCSSGETDQNAVQRTVIDVGHRGGHCRHCYKYFVLQYFILFYFINDNDVGWCMST